MEALWQTEIIFLQFFQSAGTWLEPLMQFFSFLGTENLFMAVIPFLYWCVDPGLGLRVGSMLIVTSTINEYLKQFFHFPRPYWVSEKIRALSSETSFGFPSGHAQNSASMWGIAVTGLRRRFPSLAWFGWVAALVVLGIGLSRLYLGMHFVSDVVAGWLIGLGLIWAMLRLEKPIIKWFLALPFQRQLLWAFFSSVLLIAGNLFVLSFVPGWQMPAVWLQNATAADPTHLPTPLSIAGSFTSAGTWFGLVVGAAWLWRQGGFDTRGSLLSKILRYLIGMIGILVFWYGLGEIFPRGEEAFQLVLRYFRYTLVGAWVAAGAPLLYLRMGLVKANPIRPLEQGEKDLNP